MSVYNVLATGIKCLIIHGSGFVFSQLDKGVNNDETTAYEHN